MKTGKWLVAAYGVILLLGIGFGTLAFLGFQRTTAQLQRVVWEMAHDVIEIERLRAASNRHGLAVRSYLLTRDERFLEDTRAAAQDFREGLDSLGTHLLNPQSALLMARVREIDAVTTADLERLFAEHRRLTRAEVAQLVERRGEPLRDRVSSLLSELSMVEERALQEATREASESATRAIQSLSVLAIISLLVALGLTLWLVRALKLLSRSRRALEESVQRLSVANQDLDSFVGRVAHDLRNVVSPLSLVAELLEHKPNDAAAVHRIAERLARVSRTAEGLIASYLSFARAGQASASSESALARKVLDDVLEDLAPVIAERQASVRVESGDDLVVPCAPSLLHTVLMNLIENGLKYLDGGSRREITVSLRALGDACEIRVTDGGCGIPEHALERIFEPFYRLPGVVAPGTGIGLATVARIVNAHGGRISVESTLGRGSTFTVMLPRSQSSTIVAKNVVLPGRRAPAA